MKDTPMTDGMLDCQEVMQQLWAYLDRELTPDRMVAVSSHLALCTRCYPQFNFERAFLKALREVLYGHQDITALRERVQEALWAEGLAGI